MQLKRGETKLATGESNTPRGYIYQPVGPPDEGMDDAAYELVHIPCGTVIEILDAWDATNPTCPKCQPERWAALHAEPKPGFIN